MDRNFPFSFPVQERGGVKLSQQEYISRQKKLGTKDLVRANVDLRTSCRLVDWETEKVYGREIHVGLQINRTTQTQEIFNVKIAGA